ncbi:MAG TPA: hypothetical protein VKQ36_12575, partial [Ktedonobacterales bacterium]|nr:hypothetical protein [Ktedonobacterales bacterium]
MMTDHLRQVMERLGQLPEPVQERFATELEVDLDREEAQERKVSSAEQAEYTAQGDQEEPETFPGYPLGVNPLEKYIGRLVDRFPHLSDDEALAMEAAGEIPDDDTQERQ